jgi:hypothetical protein
MKKKTIPQMKEELRRLKFKPPRFGVQPGKVIPDKTKYSRKKSDPEINQDD